MLTGCSDPPDLVPLPDPVGDDDDDDATADHASLATFAMAMEGEVDATGAPSLVTTKTSGVFQFVYWTEKQSGAPLCRQRIPFLAEARFGPLTSASCAGCSGTLQFTEVLDEIQTEPEPAGIDDFCTPEMLAAGDLSFLLHGESDVDGQTEDFTTLALISADQLMQQDWFLSPDGVHISELIDTYAAAGLTATHLAMVRNAGWLADHAGLDGIASPWGTQGWLPMFVVYRGADRPAEFEWLPGEVFMTSLWQVALGDPAPPLTPPDGTANFN